MTDCFTIVSLDNIKLSSEKPDADPKTMLALASVVGAEVEAHKDELDAMLLDLMCYGQCASLNGKRISPDEYLDRTRRECPSTE